MAKTAILIDDDQDDLDILREVIATIDNNVLCLTFTNPEEAMRVITHDLVFIPDFIFIDINMPRLAGEDCLDHLRKLKEFSRSIITMVSTSMPGSIQAYLLAKGANFAFKKPVKMAEYRTLVQPILEFKYDLGELG